MAPTSYEELVNDVQAQGGIAAYQMAVLRDMQGAGKLGKYVRENIGNALLAHGLGYFPELPVYQDQMVRVYRHDTDLARVVEAVLRPSNAGDKALRSIEGDDDAREALEQIKKIVGQV